MLLLIFIVDYINTRVRARGYLPLEGAFDQPQIALIYACARDDACIYVYMYTIIHQRDRP